jgi:uncharacterized protein (TIGR02996 family)
VDVAELFQAVYADPDDDELRLVLADALLAQGDPRGDFIQLQFDDRRDQSLARKLIQQHGLSWLGGLRGHLIPYAYEKGFVSEGRLQSVTGASGKPELGTLRTLVLDVGGPAILSDSHLRGLREISVVEDEVVIGLFDHPAALARLSSISGPWEAMVEHLGALLALPRIECLGLRPCGDLVRGTDGRLSRLESHNRGQTEELVRRLPADFLTEVVFPTLHRYR